MSQTRNTILSSIPDDSKWFTVVDLADAFFSVAMHKESRVCLQVKVNLPTEADGPLHDLKPGDWVVIKDLIRSRWNKPRWLGLAQVLLTTHTTVKFQGRKTWTHASHCKRAPDPEG
ncbi:hypothetical protein P4O66_015837 [Electrophorus voltai]|uniref:Murine leukemia virus integrase C-terminal domain-containing protein n=1 Tax=Electrophorus voltai TaxID=2609070 RepID=A0AAD9DQF3_9TELE|nr:hypothetical protein P4O66_015837 [Electrophorus voltai]